MTTMGILTLKPGLETETEYNSPSIPAKLALLGYCNPNQHSEHARHYERMQIHSQRKMGAANGLCQA